MFKASFNPKKSSCRLIHLKFDLNFLCRSKYNHRALCSNQPPPLTPDISGWGNFAFWPNCISIIYFYIKKKFYHYNLSEPYITYTTIALTSSNNNNGPFSPSSPFVSASRAWGNFIKQCFNSRVTFMFFSSGGLEDLPRANRGIGRYSQETAQRFGLLQIAEHAPQDWPLLALSRRPIF